VIPCFSQQLQNGIGSSDDSRFTNAGYTLISIQHQIRQISPRRTYDIRTVTCDFHLKKSSLAIQAINSPAR
jgi:hypothetical protein